MEFLLLVLVVLAHVIVGTLSLGSEGGNTFVGWEDYKECGGVVPIATTYPTTISYKEGQVLSPREYCVWTLLPQENIQTVRIQIIQNMTDTHDWDGLIAFFWDGADLTSLKLPGNNTDVTFDNPPTFLVFSSTLEEHSNGFRIFITSTGPPGLTTARAYHIRKEEGVFSYPEGESGKVGYRNNDRVSIVVQTQPVETWAFRMKQMKLRDVDTEPEFDVVSVYTLIPYADSTTVSYVLMGRFSGNDAADFPINSFYPTVFLFTSNRRVTGKGFTIEWQNYRHEVEL